MLISKEYAELNRQMHEQPEFGIIGQRYVEIVREMSASYQTKSILDYGCGKRTMEKALGFDIANYDPAIPGLDKSPMPADIVVCTDVLEHIEFPCLDEVLIDLRRCTKRAFMAVITVVLAGKTLPDGTNPHRIIAPFDWWLPRLNLLWRMTYFNDLKKRFIYIGEPR